MKQIERSSHIIGWTRRGSRGSTEKSPLFPRPCLEALPGRNGRGQRRPAHGRRKNLFSGLSIFSGEPTQGNVGLVRDQVLSLRRRKEMDTVEASTTHRLTCLLDHRPTQPRQEGHEQAAAAEKGPKPDPRGLHHRRCRFRESSWQGWAKLGQVDPASSEIKGASFNDGDIELKRV